MNVLLLLESIEEQQQQKIIKSEHFIKRYREIKEFLVEKSEGKKKLKI